MANITIFKFTARSFLDVFNAFKAKFTKLPDFIFKDIAGAFDLQSEMINNSATDILDPFTRIGATGRAGLSAYSVVQADGSTTTLTITLNSAMAKILAIGYQVAGLSPAGVKNIFELTAPGDSGGTDTITVAAKQQRTITDKNLGSVPSSAPFIEIPIDGISNIIKTSISLTIGGPSWTRVDNFDDSISSDKHFRLDYFSNGISILVFGDGDRGEIPPAGSTILGTFAVTNGLNGQMEAGTITDNEGGDTDIQSITNTATSGGNNPESIAAIKRNSGASIRFKEAVFSKEDIELACLAADSSVVKALGIPGIGIANSQIIPSSGGQPGAPLISTVEAFVKDKTLFKFVPFNVLATDYKTQAIAFDFVRTVGADPTITKKLLEFAMTLASNARDNMTLEEFDDNGIDAARTNVINVVYPLSGTWGFTATENAALEKIINVYRGTLGGFPHRLWGDPLEFGTLSLIGESLIDFGVKTFDLTTPSSNQNTDNANQIFDTGTITGTDIT